MKSMFIDQQGIKRTSIVFSYIFLKFFSQIWFSFSRTTVSVCLFILELIFLNVFICIYLKFHLLYLFRIFLQFPISCLQNSYISYFYIIHMYKARAEMCQKVVLLENIIRDAVVEEFWDGRPSPPAIQLHSAISSCGPRIKIIFQHLPPIYNSIL